MATTRKSSSSSSATKKSPADKSGTTKSAAKKSGANKTTAKKTTTRSSPQRGRGSGAGRTAAKAEAAPRAKASRIAASAAEELLALTGREAEGVTGLESTDDGWLVQVEVVEVRRIPDTTDVLALYEVRTDSSGSLQGYRRLRRYVRGTPGEE